jgi:hypothetical protein
MVNVWLENENSNAKISVDYDAYFNNGVCEKYPSVHFESNNTGQYDQWEYTVKEDNMDTMYNTMLDYFRGESNT